MGNWKFVLNIADKSIEATFSPSELPDIYEGMMGKYKVDKKDVSICRTHRERNDYKKIYRRKRAICCLKRYIQKNISKS
jgi:hypothetical protein